MTTEVLDISRFIDSRPKAKFVSFKLAQIMSKYSQYGIFSEQLTALGFGFVTDFNFDAQEAK